MQIIWTILIGFVVGLIAKAITPGRDPSGFIITAVIGIVGALLATFAGRAMGWYAPGETAGFLAALVGAVIVLVIYHLVRGRSVTT